METVVKEMSHLFQFFPDEVQPLEYPVVIDPIDSPGNLNSSKRAHLSDWVFISDLFNYLFINYDLFNFLKSISI